MRNWLRRTKVTADTARRITGISRGGSVCLNTVRGVSKWICRLFQAAARIGVAMLMYA